jgi:hypothetical protein
MPGVIKTYFFAGLNVLHGNERTCPESSALGLQQWLI